MLLSRSLLMPLLWLSALFLLLAGCSDSASLAQPYYHQVAAAPLQLQHRYQVSNAYPGRVEAPQRFDMGFDAQGKIIEILVDVGDEIAQGQLLARLDTGLLDAQRLSVLAQRQEKQAQLKSIGIELSRQVELREQGFAVEQTMDKLLAQQAIQQAGFDQVAATLASVDQQLEKTAMRSPFDGRVASRFVDPGQVVPMAAPVLRLLQGGSVVLQVGVPVRSARHLLVGKKYRVNFEGRIIDAPILSLGTAVSPATQTLMVELLLPKSATGEPVYDGQIARLILDEIREKKGFWIPTDAMTGGVRGTWNISVLQSTADNTADQQALYKIVRRKINILYAAGENSYVEGEFAPAELLLMSGVHRLAPGQRVILNTETAASLTTSMGQ
jgi:membrane fusion protein, multidrug efflux system